MTQEDILRAWAENKSVGKKGYSLSTNGDRLFSYDLCIGKTSNGVKKLIPLDGVPVTITTRKHINKAKRYINSWSTLNA